MTGIALCYEPRAGALPPLTCGALAARGLRVKKVGPADLERNVGFLAGLDPEAPAPETPSPAPEEPAVIFCGVTDQTLDASLAALKRAKYFGLKAVLTQTNRAWTLGALLSELVRERAAMAEGDSAHG